MTMLFEFRLYDKRTSDHRNVYKRVMACTNIYFSTK